MYEVPVSHLMEKLEITDRRLARPRSITEVVRAAVTAGAPAIQLRDKEASARELAALKRDPDADRKTLRAAVEALEEARAEHEQALRARAWLVRELVPMAVPARPDELRGVLDEGELLHAARRSIDEAAVNPGSV